MYEVRLYPHTVTWVGNMYKRGLGMTRNKNV